jgi:hypothetical protein
MRTSEGDGGTRQLTIRIPGDLYRRTQKLAKARKVSVNALVTRMLRDLEREERDHELERAFDLLGRSGGNDVEYALPAQREVLDDE